MRADDDPCEVCGVAEGTTVSEGLFICGKCAKKIKKKKRKENPSGS